MVNVFYANFSGFNIVLIDELIGREKIEEIKKKSVLDWRYIVITRRIVGFPIVFKNIFDNYGSGEYYVKIYFYELREKPVEMIICIQRPRTLVLIDSVPDIVRLLQRILSNPKYGETIVFIAKIDGEIDLSKYSKSLRLARKLYTELSPLVYSRGMGRFLALKLSSKNGSLDIVLCVSREGVSLETSHGDIKLNIRGIDRCLSDIKLVS
ncbi:MAG: hypothetical protein B6U89_01720 [Desulfurococcales archaeon ex4484_58]|nr:MAG: hypothetical protein B6U89_01720 [Desulfurococcales archaeon ex4484_58]